MRVWYRKPGMPSKTPPGLTHLEGNQWMATKKMAGHEAVGADPESWSMDPVPQAAEAAPATPPAAAPEAGANVVPPLTRAEAARQGHAASKKSKHKDDEDDEDEG